MRYDKQAKVMKQTRVDDGMGGFTQTPSVVATIQAFTTPLHAELALKEYGIVTTTGMKLFTKDTIPASYDYLEINSIKYKVLQLSDFGKIKMLLVEVI
jgi:hypothetical protein